MRELHFAVDWFDGKDLSKLNVNSVVEAPVIHNSTEVLVVTENHIHLQCPIFHLNSDSPSSIRSWKCDLRNKPSDQTSTFMPSVGNENNTLRKRWSLSSDSFQVSSSGTTRWLNRGKCAGWHSGSNYRRLTSDVTMEISSRLFGHMDIDPYRVFGRFLPFNKSLVLLYYVWFRALLPVGGRRQPRFPRITLIFWWIVTQCPLPPVGIKCLNFYRLAFTAIMVVNVQFSAKGRTGNSFESTLTYRQPFTHYQ